MPLQPFLKYQQGSDLVRRTLLFIIPFVFFVTSMASFAGTLTNADRIIKRGLNLYSSHYDSGWGLSQRSAATFQACKATIENSLKSCSGDCNMEKTSEIKQKISECIEGVYDIKAESRKHLVQMVLFEKELKDGHYDNVPQFKKKLSEKTIDLIEENKNFYSSLDATIRQYQELYLQVMSAQYQEALKKGSMQGKIIGTCSYLKNAIFKLELLTQNNISLNSYFAASQFLENVQAHEQLAVSLEKMCPASFKPAKYSDLVTRLQKHLKSLSPRKEITTACQHSNKNEYQQSICGQKSIPINAYTLNILRMVSP